MANKQKSSADIMINVVIAIVLIAVIGLAGYAIYGKVSTDLNNKAIEAGEKAPTVGYLAAKDGEEIEDYLAYYGVTDLNKNSTEEELTDKMTFENFAKYSGSEMAEVAKQFGLDTTPEATANWGEIRKDFTLKNVLGGSEEQFKQIKEMYKLDDSITMDSKWTDVEPIIKAAAEKMQEEAATMTQPPAEVATAAPDSNAAPAASTAPADAAAPQASAAAAN